ncbi:MAG: hypothetical protein HY012_00280 [Acidobacteria bacterium]|nr:hypothetical protein [Acidobacteriota bacterium]
MGDPEAQAVVLRMDFDLAEALMAIAEKKLRQVKAKWNPAASACVVMASGGYPGDFEAGKKIEGLPRGNGAVVFHAGTRRQGVAYYTSSGRVLAVAAAAGNLPDHGSASGGRLGPGRLRPRAPRQQAPSALDGL